MTINHLASKIASYKSKETEQRWLKDQNIIIYRNDYINVLRLDTSNNGGTLLTKVAWNKYYRT